MGKGADNLNGGTSSHAPMATDGVPFITASQCATLVSMPPILVADQPSSTGETVPSGTRPVILSSTGRGVKSECRLVVCALVAGVDVFSTVSTSGSLRETV